MSAEHEQLDLTAAFAMPDVGRHQAIPRDTSLAAARAVGPKLGGQRRQVLDALTSAGSHGLTDEELRDRTSVVRARTRRQELIENFNIPINDSGRRRKVRSGQTAIVWVLEA